MLIFIITVSILDLSPEATKLLFVKSHEQILQFLDGIYIKPLLILDSPYEWTKLLEKTQFWTNLHWSKYRIPPRIIVFVIFGLSIMVLLINEQKLKSEVVWTLKIKPPYILGSIPLFKQMLLVKLQLEKLTNALPKWSVPPSHVLLPKTSLFENDDWSNSINALPSSNEIK